MERVFGPFLTLRWLAAAVITCLIISPVPVLSLPDSSSPPAQIPVSSMEKVVTGTTPDSTVIRILADQPCIPVIHYANESWCVKTGSYDHEISGIQSCTSQAIRLNGLDPSVTYRYRINGCGAGKIEGIFTTFPKAGSCRFVVYGDTREQAPLYTQTERHRIVADRIAEEPDIMFVLNSGDLVADSEDGAEWERFFNSTDQLRSATTYIAVPGNHDQDRTLFNDLFGMDMPDSFDCGNFRIMLLDSTDAASLTLPEQSALISSAFSPVQGAKIVILHHPPYSSDENHYGGWQNLQRDLVPAFQESGVQLVFSSHVHAFEQVERNGITYITEARGGAPAYPLNISRISGSIRAYENTLGYSRVTVDPKKGMITIDVIRVADTSPDLRSVVKMYPAGTIDARIIIPISRSFTGLPDITELMKGISNRENVSLTETYRFL